MNSNDETNYEEIEIINPESIIQKPTRRTTKLQFENEPIEDLKVTDIQDYKKNYNNYGSTVKIDLESNGRFGNPKTIILKDYTARHINDLVTTKEEDLLETLINILNDCIVSPEKFDIGNLTNEEFYEVILGMKLSFDSPILKHKWIHEDDSCQGKKEDNEKQISESLIDLREIKGISIEESDEKIKSFYKERFNEMNDKEFSEYLLVKYGDYKDITKDEEINNIKIQEPFLIKGYDTDYEFKMIRMKDLLHAYKLSSKEVNHKIRVVQNRIIKKGDNEEKIRSEKEEEIDKLKREKARKVLEYAQAMSLSFVRRNGKRIQLKTIDEKIKEYNSMPRNVLLNYLQAIDTIRYGVDEEIHLHCNLCDGTERGYLQRLISPFLLLPVRETEGNNPTRNVRQSSGLNFYF